MRGRLVLAFGIGACLVLARGAQGATIDFEDLGVAPGTQLNVVSQASGGYDFSSVGADLHFHNQDGFGNNGTTNMGAHAFVDFSPTGGGSFNLFSFDFEYFTTDLGSITVVGTYFGGGTTTQVFGTDGIANTGGASTYETFLLNPTFTNLVSARITSNIPNNPSVNGFFVDNISQEVIPEPATLLLLGTGLAAAGVRRRMRKRS